MLRISGQLRQRYAAEAIIYLIAITIAEIVTTLAPSPWGLICLILVIAVIIVRSAILAMSRYQRLILPLILVPLLRLVSEAIPLKDMPRIMDYHFGYVPTALSALAVMFILRQTLKEVGVSIKQWPVQLLVGVTGFAIGSAEYYILDLEPMIEEFTISQLWLPAILLMITTGFMAEFVFRGVLLSGSAEVLGYLGVFYVAILFSITYIGFLPPIGISLMFVVGLFYGTIARNTGSILGVALSRGVSTVWGYLVLPFMT